MGREIDAVCHWGNATAEARLVLEARELLVRGGLKVRLLRSEILSAAATDAGLVVTTPSGTLVAELDRAVAVRWAEALSTPPPKPP
jgi:hypothetical protein